tara:strand:+ start:3369 stop:4526 length:1158 start_codon:yes stop_codon:yes gene_type:complete
MHEQTSNRLPMDRFLYGGLENAIKTSKFWLADNEYTEVRSSAAYGAQFFQTDAARNLQKAIQLFFRSNRFPASVVVITLDPDDITNKSKAYQTNEKPNHFVVAASAGLTGKKDKLLLELLAVESVAHFDSSLVDPQKIAADISKTIRHELVHSGQYDSLAKSMGISRAEAKKKFEDWGLIPGSGNERSAYLGSHIEIDAFGHEFAERLADHFGVDKTLELLDRSNNGSLQNMAMTVDLGSNFFEFFDKYPDEPFTTQLIKKIRKYVLRFKHHNIYEKLTRELRDRQMKITKTRLRRLIREVTDYATGEELIRTDEMQPPGVNRDFASEPPRNASFAAWKFRIETDVLSDDDIASSESDVRELYAGWKSGKLSWDEVVDYVLDLAY